MSGFERSNPLLSLCGLNCGLCTMRLGGHCSGCGIQSQTCKVARCSIEHGRVEYCFRCGEYPCEKYEHAQERDSFITHLNQKKDMEKAKRIGIEAYNAEQKEKAALLQVLLDTCNDGRRKTLYCLAVNLLEADEIRSVLKAAAEDEQRERQPIKEKAAFVAEALRKIAAGKGIELKLRKK